LNFFIFYFLLAFDVYIIPPNRWYVDRKKAKNKIKEKEFEKRHNERVEKAFREFDGLDMIKICAGSNDYAA